MAGDDIARQDVIRWLRAKIARATGRRYEIDLDALDLRSLCRLQRLVQDLDGERRRAVRRARREPWRT